MAWGQSREKSSFSKHLLSLGAFGGLIAIGGICSAGLLALNLFAAIFWTTVQAEVRSIDALCTLEYRSGSTKSKSEGLDCDQAEAIKNAAVNQYMTLTSEGTINFAWTSASGHERTAQVEDYGPSGDFKDLKQGDIATIRVSGGSYPWIHSPRSWTTIGAMIVFAFFAWWLCWPSNPNKPSRLYVADGPALKVRVWLASHLTGVAALSAGGLGLSLVLLAGSYFAEPFAAATPEKYIGVAELFLVKWSAIALCVSIVLGALVGIRVRRPVRIDMQELLSEKANQCQDKIPAARSSGKRFKRPVGTRL